MSAVRWSELTPTPNLAPHQILFTCGGTITINAAASDAFDVISSFSRYEEWNSWTPAFVFSEPDGHVIEGAKGTLRTEMKAQKRTYEIPIEILELERTPHLYKLAWQSQLMPTWMATLERVQTVEPLEGNPKACKVRSWESSSGFAAYAFKYVMGVPDQVTEANLHYLEELKARVEETTVGNN